ncbi:GTPase ObgE [Candidatus Uabimicrobium sp. HlEnr_7]|uniref:GTPase ObgE n=1 Tax=Candidatus Uabimicrobium helgolandensis TaxID=3095367 RepID=UPI003556B40C
MFKDEAKIYVRSGDGGNGCISFLREKYKPKGGPDGGDGGRGGDVIIRASVHCSTLLELIRRRKLVARNGESGKGKKCTGRSADDLVIEVPIGTIIRDDAGELVADLTEHGCEIAVVKGGKGGRGNVHFATSTHQTPREAEAGQKGEDKNLHLDLKLIADVGLVGFPNAGKSTLLSRVSAAKPKIADYPFTTLEPQLGIAELLEYKTLVIADIPGLIEGAHKGIGLGDRFLRHIERTRTLLYVLEMTPDQEKTPKESLEILQKELRSHSKVLSEKPYLIAASKMDIPGSEDVYEALSKEFDQKIYKISSVTGQGLKELLFGLFESAQNSKNNEESK